MRINGYEDNGLDSEEIIPVELAEITLVASPIELRKIAAFLEFAADEIDRMGESFSHVHLSDRLKEFKGSPHFIVARS